MKPHYSKLIETPEDLVNSGIPWKLIVYGSIAEIFMAKSDHPDIKTIWKWKIIKEYTPSIEVKHKEFLSIKGSICFPSD